MNSGPVWLAMPSPRRTRTVYLPPVSRRTRHSITLTTEQVRSDLKRKYVFG